MKEQEKKYDSEIILEYRFVYGDMRELSYVRLCYIREIEAVYVQYQFQSQRNEVLGQLKIEAYPQNGEGKKNVLFPSLIIEGGGKTMRTKDNKPVGCLGWLFKIRMIFTKEGDKTPTFDITQEVANLQDAQYQRELTVCRETYEALRREREALWPLTHYRKLFFAMQGKLREAIGMTHYAPFHQDISPQKFKRRILGIMGNSIYNIVYHEGFVMESGLLRVGKEKKTSLDTLDPTLGISLPALKEEIDSLRREVTTLKSYDVYLTFWQKVHPLLQSYELKEDCEEDELLQDKSMAQINQDMIIIAQCIASCGYVLRYVEDFEAGSPQADQFMRNSRYGYPALYTNGENPSLVSSSEGAVDGGHL